MFYYNNRRLLSEGMSLEQIKQGKNPELLAMFEDFKRRLFHWSDGARDQLSRKIETFFVEYMNNLYNSDAPMSNDFLLMKQNQAEDAYAEYILVNVIEYHEDYVDELDLNNPTNGLRGKFTEFILRILSSSTMKNSNLTMKAQFIFLNFFITKILKIPASKTYQSKNMFFDNVIIPLMDERVRNGEKLGSVNPETGIKGANFSRPSPVAPLQDKIMKVFDTYGSYNGKNLLETIMEEIVPGKVQKEIETFAGYDTKLIDYCLSQGYWKEFHVVGQPSTTRLFFIGNGDLENLSTELGDNYQTDEEEAWEDWQNDYDMQTQFPDFTDYLMYYMTEVVPVKNQEKTITKSFSYYHTLRGLIYACNIYPFKTPYNIAKGNAKISSAEVAFFKSLNSDDYLVGAHDYNFKIRKTTDWCTKDTTQAEKYIMPGSEEKVEGFILCLNDALEFDNPNGTLQIGIKTGKADGNSLGYFHNKNLTLNADDFPASCPDFLDRCFTNFPQTFLINLLNQGKKQYENIKNLNFPKNLSTEEKKAYFEKMKQTNLSENLLRKYIRCLLS